MRLRMAGQLVVISIVILMVSPAIHPVGDGASAGIPDEQRIEILIRNYDFEIIHRTPVTLGGEAVIILRNQDIVRHGVTSPALPQLYLRMEGEGVGAYGRGIDGLYIEPCKTLVIRLVIEHSGRLTFHCDLHPEMKSCSTSPPRRTFHRNESMRMVIRRPVGLFDQSRLPNDRT